MSTHTHTHTCTLPIARTYMSLCMYERVCNYTPFKMALAMKPYKGPKPQT